MGPRNTDNPQDISNAYELGKRIATEGWVLLSGGMAVGVMKAVNKGAKDAGGLTVGILPTVDTLGASDDIEISIITGMGAGRNNINVLSSDVVIACGLGSGTASEIALAIAAHKPVILINDHPTSHAFFKELGGVLVSIALTPLEAIEKAKSLLKVI